MKRLTYSLVVLALTLQSFFGSVAVAQEPPPPIQFSADLIACLKTALGDQYETVANGNLDLSDADNAKAEECFGKFAPAPGNQGQPPKAESLKFAPATEECLKKTLGENFRQIMISQGRAIRAQIKDCFGGRVGAGSANQLPETVRSCIEKAVGIDKAKAMFAGTPPDPDSPEAAAIGQANCFENFDHGEGRLGGPHSGPPPQMSAEALQCFKDRTGGATPEQRPKLTEEQRRSLQECFQGPGGPNGPAGSLPVAIVNCFKEVGLDLETLKKGSNLLTGDQEQKAKDCFQRNNFQGGPGGPNGGPEGGPGQGPKISDEAKKCIEGIIGSIGRQTQPTEEQRQRIGNECFKGDQKGQNGELGGLHGQGGPNGEMPPAVKSCVEKLGLTPGPNLNDDQKRQMQACIGQNGGFSGPGPGTEHNTQGQPPVNDRPQTQGGPNNNNAPEGGLGNLPPQVVNCLREKFGLSAEEAQAKASDSSFRDKFAQCNNNPGPGQPAPGAIQPPPNGGTPGDTQPNQPGLGAPPPVQY